MFGIIRTVWAFMVLVGHLFWLADFGRFAVFGFFILSGMLMTLVMQQSYGYSANGRLRFATNRLIRLYPIYWIASGISLLLILLLGQEATTVLDRRLRLPDSWGEILANVFMVFPRVMPNTFPSILSPAAWALTSELVFYALIAMGISRTKNRCFLWLAISITYTMATYVLDFYWHSRYFAIPAASLPFCLGALLYHYLPNIKTSWPMLTQRPAQSLCLVLVLFLIQLANAIFGSLKATNDEHVAMEICFYINILLSLLIVAILASVSSGERKSLRKFDKAIGDYSYPIYLIHWQVGLVVSVLYFGEVRDLAGSVDLSVIALSTFATLLLSTILIHLVDKRVDGWRDRIRGAAST